MNEKIVFVRTVSGEDEARGRTALLSKDIKRALLMVDGTASVAEILKRSSPSLRGMLEYMFVELVKGDFIQDKAKVAMSSKLVLPASPKKTAEGGEELDFTSAFRVPTPAMLEEEAAKVVDAAADLQVEAARASEEAARVKAEQQALEAGRRAELVKTEQEAAKARAEAEIRARAVVEEKRKLEAEVAKLKAQAELEAQARAVAAEHAKLEAARKAEQAAAVADERVRLEAEIAQLKAQSEKEARARAVAEEQDRLEAARIQEKRAADAARFKAEQDVVEAQIRAEAAQARLAAEQAERLAREAQARAQAEHDAADAARRAEQCAAKIKAEADLRARGVAEEKEKLEIEVAKLKAQAEADARARLDAETRAQAEQEAARIKAEQDASSVVAEAEAEACAEAAAAKVREAAERVTQEAGEQNNPAESSDKLDDFNFDAFDAALSMPDAHQILAHPQSDSAAQLLKDVVGLAEMGAVESVVVPALPDKPVDASRAEQKIKQEPHYSEAEARQLADAQAKKWEDAELRSVEAARQKAESVPQMVSPHEAVIAKRVRRKPMPWGKWLAGFVALLVVALFVVPLVLPTQGYVTSIEQALSAKLQQPVHIGHLEGRILPTPRLVLSDISIGETKPVQVRQAQVNFAFSALFGQVKAIAGLDLDGVQIKGEALPQVSSWLQQVAGDHQYPVARIILSKGVLDADGMQFSDVDGELNFERSGTLSLAKLNAGGHKLALEIRAAPEQKFALTVTLRDSALPLFPDWLFEELKATGELSRDELRIRDLDGRIMGGALSGEVRINWRSGWRVQGALAVKSITLQNINKLLGGDLDGTARFQMQTPKLAKLAEAAVLNGVFSVKKGIINGVDIVETARLRSRESLPGGRTHFNELSGELSYADGSYQFRQLKINDSVVKAVGALAVSRQELSGNISADLTMRAGSVALQVGGTIASPSLRAIH